MGSRPLQRVGLWTMTALATGLSLPPAVGSRMAAANQAPAVFRSGVDLVAVDVQVVGSDGTPVESLGPADFEVSIGGRRRRVVSVDFVRSTQADGSPLPDAATQTEARSVGGIAPAAQATETTGRVYVLAFDTAGLSVGDSRAMVQSATAFIDRLLPADRVGVAVFPVGNQLAPSLDHTAAHQRVNEVIGGRANSEGFDSRFNLSSSEVIDINAEAVRAMPSPFATQGAGRGVVGLEDLTLLGADNDTIRTVQMRECRATDVRCGDEIRAEALAAAFVMEARAVESLNGIQRLIGLLASYEGRKTVVLFSAGMPTSDRPGGRPNLGSLPAAIGKSAAASNTTIYTLHVDSAHVRAMGAGTGRAMGSAGSRSRDFAVEGQVLEDFSAASGGALLRVPTGWGETALQRVLRETSSRYLLGVEPQASDRDGRVRELRVRVRQRGVTVRGRSWVALQ